MVFPSRFNLLKPPLLLLQTHLALTVMWIPAIGLKFPSWLEWAKPHLHTTAMSRKVHAHKKKKKALSGFEVCRVFANTQMSHFCLVHSWPSPYRSESSGRKPFSPRHLSSYAPLSINIHKGTAVCKVWFEGCVGLAYSATNFVRSDSSVTFLWLPITQISSIGAFLLCLCKRHTH